MSWLDKFFTRGYTTLMIAGVALPSENILNIVSGATATDDQSNGRTNLTITSSFTAGGDLSGTTTSQTVVGFRGRVVSTTAPTDGQVYAWSNSLSQWVPTTISAGALPAGSTGTLQYNGGGGAFASAANFTISSGNLNIAAAAQVTGGATPVTLLQLDGSNNFYVGGTAAQASEVATLGLQAASQVNLIVGASIVAAIVSGGVALAAGSTVAVSSTGVFTYGSSVAAAGYHRFPLATSSYQVLSGRNSGNTADLGMLRISSTGPALLIGSNDDFGSGAFPLLYICSLGSVNFSMNGTTMVGISTTAVTYQSAQTIDWGNVLSGGQGTVTDRYLTNTSATTANQTIATIPLTTGVNLLVVYIQATSGSDWVNYTHAWSYRLASGTITAASQSQPSATHLGGTTTAGTGAAVQFAISGTNILVQVTPWTASTVGWIVDSERFVKL